MDANAAERLRHNDQRIEAFREELNAFTRRSTFENLNAQRDSREARTRDLLERVPGINEGIGANGEVLFDLSMHTRRAAPLQQRQRQDPDQQADPVLPLPSRELTSGAEEQEQEASQEEQHEGEPVLSPSEAMRQAMRLRRRLLEVAAVNASGPAPNAGPRDPFTRCSPI